MRYLYLDFETRSRLDLKRVGAYRYAEDPSTQALCASWAIDQMPDVLGWRPGMVPLWLQWADRPDVLIVAHNAEFERVILKHLFHRDFPPSKFICTMALVASVGLPRSLDLSGQVLNLEHKKDKAKGTRSLHKLAQPRRPSKDNPAEFWERDTAAKDFDELEDYNAGDTAAHREIHQILPPLSTREQKVWELTITMNERGVRLDVEALEWVERAAAEEVGRLTEKWLALTGGVKPGSPKAAAALGLDSLAKLAVRQALRRHDLPPQVREALKVRQMLARTSLRKTVAMRAQVCADGKLRGLLVYAGAERTSRWSGAGVQVHNLPRGLKGPAQAEAFETLRSGVFALVYDDVLRTLSDMLKGLITGPWLIGDYGQVEARDLAWLSGQKDLIDDFRADKDVYCDMASVIYGRTITKADYDPVLKVDKRQLGKMAILGCGYGMGAATFVRQAEKDYDVLLDEDTARAAVGAYRKRFSKVTAFWNLLERGMVQTLRTRPACIQVGPVRMGMRDFHGRIFSYVQLPSGRPIYYYSPRIEQKTIPMHIDRGDAPGTPGGWGPHPVAERLSPPSIRYQGRDRITHQWQEIESYGGLLTENTVQADSRDIMADAMLRLEAAGFKLAFTVHDEIVAHDDGQKDALSEFERIMKTPPGWHKGFPLAVEAFTSWRYCK